MKKHVSVLALCARNTLAVVIALLCALCVGESVIFWINWHQDPASDSITFESALQGVPAMCFTFLMLVMVQLCKNDGSSHSTGYTLRRLKISEKTVVLWNGVYNSICLFLFWGVQTAVVLGLGRWYTRLLDPSYVSPQTLFLAFYRDPFLHNLLPLGNWTRYLCIGSLLLAAGFCASLMTCKLRRGSRYGWVMPLLACILLAVYFRQGVEHWSADAFGVFSAAALIGLDAFYCWRNADYEE